MIVIYFLSILSRAEFLSLWHATCRRGDCGCLPPRTSEHGRAFLAHASRSHLLGAGCQPGFPAAPPLTKVPALRSFRPSQLLSATLLLQRPQNQTLSTVCPILVAYSPSTRVMAVAMHLPNVTCNFQRVTDVTAAFERCFRPVSSRGHRHLSGIDG